MIKPGKARRPEKGMSKKTFERIEDTYRYGLVLHEIRYAPTLSSTPPPQPMLDFGYGLDDCEVWNYWDDERPLHVSDPDCKWLLLKRNGKLLMVLVTWNGDKADVTASLDLDALDVDVETVVDAVTGETVTAVNGESFALAMEAFGVRALIIE
jgi:hypothetical protein